jgi:hypothetical protein
MHSLERLLHSGATELLIGSVAVLVLGVVLVPVVVTRLPADYFVRLKSQRPHASAPMRFVLYWLRNLFGVLLVLAGVLMLVLPGQGLLTILAGLSLVDFPGKRKLQLKLLRIPQIHHTIDHIRQRAGKPPLRLDERTA